MDLMTWWQATSQRLGEAATQKAKEYGSQDLAVLGRELRRMAGLPPAEPPVTAETGIFMYLLGKVARWSEANRGDYAVSTDTIEDIITYAMMALRVRECNEWPGELGAAHTSIEERTR